MSETVPPVFVLGAGPVGRSLVRDLSGRGVPVLGIWARRASAAKRAGEDAGIVGFAGDLPRAEIKKAEILILAVRDNAIAAVAQRLEEEGLLRRQHILLHCSGAVSAAVVFSTLSSRVRGLGTIHPLASLASAKDGGSSLVGLHFGIEGNTAGRGASETLCRALAGTPIFLDASQMAGYHTAASMTSNFLVALLDSSCALLEAEGIDMTQALPALCDLAEGAIQNVRDLGLPQALTGPIRRGDTSTIQRQLEILEKKCPQLTPLFRELASHTCEIADRCGALSEKEIDEMKSLLGNT